MWPVFDEYRVLLHENGLREAVDAIRDARLLLESKGDILPYRAVIVDEAQDLSAEAFRLIRQLIPKGESENDLFIVGDAHQRIHRHKVVLGRCGVNVRGRSRTLRINSRTTEENRRWAVILLEGLDIDDLDGGRDDHQGYRSLVHGAAPEVRAFASFTEEAAHPAAYLKEAEAGGQALNTVCLAARTTELLKQYEAALKELGIKTHFIRRSEAEDLSAPGLRLATMHRVKGLEFDRVIIAGVNEGVLPYQGLSGSSSDPVVQHEAEIRERALLYVAATRARKEVLVTWHGAPSRWLARIAGGP